MNAVTKIEPAALPTAVTPMQMLQIAVERGTDLDQLQKLMDLQDRWEATQSRKAYVSAMTAFKADPPTIQKRKAVNIPGGASFFHASLAEVCEAVCAGMGRHGLAHRWETLQSDGRVTVTCVITHEAGHSERTTMTASPDDSGKKNSIQQIASTVTYLERYTLLAATGLAAQDMDDDGQGATPAVATPAPSSKRSSGAATEKQIALIRRRLDAAGVSAQDLCATLKVNSLPELPFGRVDEALEAIGTLAHA